MCAQYWPSSAGTMMKYGEFHVSTVSISENDGLTQRVIAITDPKVYFFMNDTALLSFTYIVYHQSGQVHKVTQFQLKQWSAEGLCSNPQALIDIIDQMGGVQRRTGNKAIVVHGR